MQARKAEGATRPRRGTREGTRERLVAAAAEVFNHAGYAGTDSNRLARAAGYAPGTFYKHFRDKRAIFLAVYEDWVNAEWGAVGEEIRRGGDPDEVAARIVDAALALHRRWRGLRASLRALVAGDVEARAFYRRQRRRQLGWLSGFDAPGTGRGPAEDAVLLYTLERVCDAIADGELRELGVSAEEAVAVLRARVAERVRAGRHARESANPAPRLNRVRTRR